MLKLLLEVRPGVIYLCLRSFRSLKGVLGVLRIFLFVLQLLQGMYLNGRDKIQGGAKLLKAAALWHDLQSWRGITHAQFAAGVDACARCQKFRVHNFDAQGGTQRMQCILM